MQLSCYVIRKGIDVSVEVKHLVRTSKTNKMWYLERGLMSVAEGSMYQMIFSI